MRWRLLAVMVLMSASTAPLAAAEAAQKANEPHPWFGMGVSPQQANGSRFLHVERTTPGGPAALAGILPGDIITHVDGKPLQYIDDLDFLTFMAEQIPGERLSLRIVRKGTTSTRVMKVGVMPESARPGWEKAMQAARRARIAAQRRSQ